MQSKWRRFQQTKLLIVLFYMAFKGGVILASPWRLQKILPKQTTLSANIGQIKEALLLNSQPDRRVYYRLNNFFQTTQQLS